MYRRTVRLPVGTPAWRRFWLAIGDEGTIVGHADLRARPEPHTGHRALLGMGVHRDHRGRGLGRRLLEVILAWAREQPTLVWVDLEVMAENTPARRLYERAGFRTLAAVEDMFRVDGEEVGQLWMTQRCK
jgi:ribosomal protein S18 acetylase RimI-like enzyme